MKFNKFQQDVQLKGFNQDDFQDYSNKRIKYVGSMVNGDESKILLVVSPEKLRETKYGYGLIIDAEHVVFIKSWQVLGTCYERMNSYLIVLDRNYFSVKEFQFADQGDEFGESETTTFDDFKEVAKMQAGEVIYKP